MKTSNYILVLLMVLLMNTVNSQTTNGYYPILEEAGTSTSCPFLTKNSKGVPVISFVKKTNKNEAFLCYSVFNSKSKKFQKPVIIQSSKGVELHGENAPKIIFKPNNEIIAVWGINNASEKKKYGGLVKYSQSFDNGKSWTKAKPLVKDAASIDQRYFDIDLLPNGEAAIIWLDSRTKTDDEGSTLYYAATKGAAGFQNEKPIAETTCQCCRTDLFVNSKGTVYAAFRDVIDNEIRDMVLFYSKDKGKTFSVPKRISPDNWKINGCPHTGPAMTENENGMHFAWYTAGGGTGVFYSNSLDFGKNFSKKEVVSASPNAKHPQITNLDKKEIVIVWDESVKEGDDFTGRIGFQHRNSKGKVVSTQYISPKSKDATFPVVKAVNSKQFLVAWTDMSGDQKVFYQLSNVK